MIPLLREELRDRLLDIEGLCKRELKLVISPEHLGFAQDILDIIKGKVG